MNIALGKHWGRAVAARRRKCGLTQVQLAELCNVTQQAISKIERGVSLPTDVLRISLAANLGVAPGRLFTWPTEIVEAVAS